MPGRHDGAAPRSGSPEIDDALACCHGFAISASDCLLGVVETPVFSGTGLRPDYLIVRNAESIPGRFTDVPVSLVEEVDLEHRKISLGSPLAEVARAPDPASA
jgi:hypothetical protein